MVTSVVEALERDLTEWGKVNPVVPVCAMAALALRLASDLDNPRTSANAASMVSNALKDALKELAAMVPESAGKDSIDELAEQRRQRLARRSTA